MGADEIDMVINIVGLVQKRQKNTKKDVEDIKAWSNKVPSPKVLKILIKLGTFDNWKIKSVTLFQAGAEFVETLNQV